ncbi:MAG: hypothetical protein DHS20C11_11850 [Lysobacteraceae bacterium]|nr:MAG: hypothetical protein DHS20C11_11850 [Xanthomonadaceae bacterium]
MNSALTAAWRPFHEIGLPLPNDRQLSHASLNALAKSRRLRSGGDAPIEFVLQNGKLSAAQYETQIYHDGRVPTRVDSWHDLYNACCWLRYPKLKAALNRGHCQDLALSDAPTRSRRRDKLTLLDEVGVVVFGTDLSLLTKLASHQWAQAFFDCRDLWSTMEVRVVGHGLLEQLATPYLGLTAKALLLCANDSSADPDNVDETVASLVDNDLFSGRTGRLSPLPVLGLPGWWPPNETRDFYLDQSYFRPLRDDSVVASRVLTL